uniref:Uncharacterized protein n=1 Tax=Brugia malayi TaxID=6279 RepID=A8P6V6_BRUMA
MEISMDIYNVVMKWRILIRLHIKDKWMKILCYFCLI